MNNYSALMYNVQNLYGSIAGINNKIFELENQILKQKPVEAKAGGDTFEMEAKIAQLMKTVDMLQKNQALLESQVSELKNVINSNQEVPSISLAMEVTEETQQVAEVPPANEEVFELVPPKPKGGRKKK